MPEWTERAQLNAIKLVRADEINSWVYTIKEPEKDIRNVKANSII